MKRMKPLLYAIFEQVFISLCCLYKEEGAKLHYCSSFSALLKKKHNDFMYAKQLCFLWSMFYFCMQMRGLHTAYI